VISKIGVVTIPSRLLFRVGKVLSMTESVFLRVRGADGLGIG
jgi:hypothetical protein